MSLLYVRFCFVFFNYPNIHPSRVHKIHFFLYVKYLSKMVIDILYIDIHFICFFFFIVVYIQALPQHDPIINGLAPNYAIGDFLMANCTSDRSSIPATLIWYIDEEKVGQLV